MSSHTTKPYKTRSTYQQWILGILFSLTSIISTTALAAENRCGWLENPTPANWWLNDRDGSWTISLQGGYSVSAQSMKNLPTLDMNQYVRTNGNYGYACACLSVTTDKKNERIVTIHQKGQQVNLKKCLEDRSISQQHKGKNIYISHANADSTPHFIQVLTTSNNSKASKIKNGLVRKGFRTTVTTVQHNNQTLYRVRVGAYAGRDAAQAAHARLKALFKSSSSIQNSIIINSKLEKTAIGKPVAPPKTTAKKPAPPKSQPTKITQCYQQKTGSAVTVVQTTQTNNTISGYYAWMPKERDRGYGSFRGTLKGNQIRAWHTLMIEGDIQTEELIFKREKNRLIQGRGELVARKDGSFMLKNPNKVQWRDYLNKVDCRTVASAIKSAKSVEKIIRQRKK